MIRAGTLDRRITIEAKSIARDPEYGSEAPGWLPVASRIPASVRDALPTVRRMEHVEQGIETASQMTRIRIRIRYRSGLTSAMRIVLHGRRGEAGQPDEPDRLLQIISGPAEVGRREGLEFMTEDWSV